MPEVSKTKKILEKLALGGKRVFDTLEDYENMYKFDEQIEKVRRDYLIKSYNSEIDSSNCIFTA